MGIYWNKTHALVWNKKMEIDTMFKSEKHSVWQMSFWCHDTINLNADFVGKIKEYAVMLRDVGFKKE